MSKAQIIKELALEVETTRRDYAEVVRQRDAAETTLLARENVARINNAAKREAEIQEKVDGIRAGLIPVEDLRKHIRQTFENTISQDRSSYEFKLFFTPAHTDPISLAIRDAILKEHAPKSVFGAGGYTGWRDDARTTGILGLDTAILRDDAHTYLYNWTA